MNGNPYHSALREEDPSAQALSRCEFPDGSVALQWDITKGYLPPDFAACDCFYLEPPWRAGMKVFNQRAGSPDHVLQDVVAGIAKVVQTETRPIALMCGKQDSKTYLKLCPEPQQIKETTLVFHRCSALILTWNVTSPLNYSTNEAVCQSLAAQYNCVGDFVCGYGETARVFRQNQKRFVVSDYNAKCIGHMADHL